MAVIDYPPEGTALREAVDGPRPLSALYTAQLVHAINVLTWNTRAIAAQGQLEEPYPALVLPGVEVNDDTKPKQVADLSDDEIAAMFHKPD